MAHHKSAIKRIRQAETRRVRNKHYTTSMKSAIKKVLETTEPEAAETNCRRATSLLDKLAAKNVIHANKAANQKARLAKYVNSLSAAK